MGQQSARRRAQNVTHYPGLNKEYLCIYTDFVFLWTQATILGKEVLELTRRGDVQGDALKQLLDAGADLDFQVPHPRLCIYLRKQSVLTQIATKFLLYQTCSLYITGQGGLDCSHVGCAEWRYNRFAPHH